tara:strand:- start:469 stop:1470 length:1002 start_codon:yes stop_codon:yes gene_type:complete
MITIEQLALKINGSIEGEKELLINGVGDLRTASKDCISFLSDDRYYKYFKNSLSHAIIVNKDFSNDRFNKTLIRVDNPVYAYIQAIEYFSDTSSALQSGIHQTAIISSKAKIGNNVYIGPNTVIDDDVKIGDGTIIGPSCYIAKNVIIGNKVQIKPNVTIHESTQIGHDVILESGIVIGTNGFGLTFYNGENHIIPHIGKVIINDKVWIGANCAIDRGTINDTIIGEGTKMDNLIQIAHNVIIGKHCIIAGQSAIAGSTKIGNYVTIAGQVGIIGHLKIEDNCTIASKSQVTKSLSKGSFVSGIPARDHKKNLKLNALFNKLDSKISKIKEKS